MPGIVGIISQRPSEQYARDVLEQLLQQGTRCARECLSGKREAQITTEVMYWAVGQGPKPDLAPRKRLRS
jgi:hypothetical protein